MNAKPIVSKLRTLAAEPSNRAAIVRDQGCLPGLILFLDNDDNEVVTIALEALHYLSECSVNKPLMRDEFGMTESLERLAKSPIMKHSEIAEKIRNNIAVRDKHEDTQQDAPSQTKPVRVNRTARNYIFQIAYTVQKVNKQTTQNLPSISVVKQKVEDVLLDIKGLISFTFESMRDENSETMSNQPTESNMLRIIIRCKSDLPLEKLTSPLLNITGNQFKLFQVARHPKSGQEKLVDVAEMLKEQASNTARDMPKYLDDDDDYHQQMQQQEGKSEKRGMALFPRKWGSWFGKKDTASETNNNGWLGGFFNKVFS